MGTFALIIFGLLTTFIVIGTAAQRRRIDRIRAELAGDPDVEVAPDRTSLKLHTRPPRRTAHVVPAGGGKNDPSRWDIYCSVHLEPSTTLTLSREGFFGKLREAFGSEDIHLGDAEFDRTFTVRGSDAGAVKALLSNPEAKRAIEALFTGQVWDVGIDARGNVHGRAARAGLDAATPKWLLLALVSLGDALEAVDAQQLA